MYSCTCTTFEVPDYRSVTYC